MDYGEIKNGHRKIGKRETENIKYAVETGDTNDTIRFANHPPAAGGGAYPIPAQAPLCGRRLRPPRTCSNTQTEWTEEIAERDGEL